MNIKINYELLKLESNIPVSREAVTEEIEVGIDNFPENSEERDTLFWIVEKMLKTKYYNQPVKIEYLTIEGIPNMTTLTLSIENEYTNNTVPMLAEEVDTEEPGEYTELLPEDGDYDSFDSESISEG